MSTHNICFHEQIRENINPSGLKKTPKKQQLIKSYEYLEEGKNKHECIFYKFIIRQ